MNAGKVSIMIFCLFLFKDSKHLCMKLSKHIFYASQDICTPEMLKPKSLLFSFIFYIQLKEEGMREVRLSLIQLLEMSSGSYLGSKDLKSNPGIICPFRVRVENRNQ